MSKHTCGPWVHHKDSPTDVIIAPNAPHAPSIATIDIGPYDRAEITANARLIAASPKLLSALRDLLKYHSGDYSSHGDFDAAYAAAYSAVYEATGEPA